jgi:hypothetical protein
MVHFALASKENSRRDDATPRFFQAFQPALGTEIYSG